MNYAQARASIRSGDLLAWSHRTLHSWYDFKVQTVRFFTKSEYSHVGVAWVSGGRVWVIESVTPLVRVAPLSNLLPAYHIATDLNWTPDAEQYALSFVANEQYRYSQWEAVKAFFGRNNEANTKLECAEFVLMVFARCGLFLNARATPSDVVLAAQAQCSTAMIYLTEK